MVQFDVEDVTRQESHVLRDCLLEELLAELEHSGRLLIGRVHKSQFLPLRPLLILRLVLTHLRLQSPHVLHLVINDNHVLRQSQRGPQDCITGQNAYEVNGIGLLQDLVEGYAVVHLVVVESVVGVLRKVLLGEY